MDAQRGRGGGETRKEIGDYRYSGGIRGDLDRSIDDLAV